MRRFDTLIDRWALPIVVIVIAAATAGLIALAVLTSGNGSSTDNTGTDGYGITVGTNGQPYIGVGGGVSVNPSTGKLGITTGGITIPLG